ncbi:MAG TPA: AAA family ATPase [Candidatus Angelobacter sp.]
MLVIAFSGKLGSGKTTISNAVATALGWPLAGFGDYVRQVVRERGLDGTRENLQAVGTELLEADPREFCKAVLSSGGWIRGEPLLIDGLRHVKTIAIIQELISPATLRIISILVPEATRLQRLGQRDQVEAASTGIIEAHSSEQEVGSILCSHADLVLDGEKPVSVLVAEIIDWIRLQS